MRLSNGRFESQKTRTDQIRNVALFVGTFLSLTIPTMALWRVVPHPPMPGTYPRPESDDYYLAFHGPISLDHRVLFHGEYDTPKYLKSADVLVLGNSRLMFGFPQDPLKKLFQRFNMSYYLLGFGHSECDLFPLEIIRKFDLRPKFVIVNADGFFSEARSVFGCRVIHETRFEARKQIFEGESNRSTRSLLHKYLPNWFRNMGGSVYRSRSDGTWLVPDIVRRVFPIPDQTGHDLPPPAPYNLELARRFKLEMEQRGSRVLLTFVPSEQGNREYAEQFARHLNVPLISPRLQGLETLDHSHLTPVSARRFATAFVEELGSVLQPIPSSPQSKGDRAGPGSGPVSGHESDYARSRRETVNR